MVHVDNSTFALVWWWVRGAAGMLKHQLKSTLSHSIRHVKDKWCLCLDLGLTPKISHYIYIQIFQSLNPKNFLPQVFGSGTLIFTKICSSTHPLMNIWIVPIWCSSCGEHLHTFPLWTQADRHLGKYTRLEQMDQRIGLYSTLWNYHQAWESCPLHSVIKYRQHF